jgi:serine/threonine-protein kinase
VRAAPHKRYQQRWTPSLVFVGGLLLAAIVAGGVLWATLHTSSPSGTKDTSAAPASSAPSGDAASAQAPSGGPLKLVSLAIFDPKGDGQENDTKLDLARDGDPSTAWRTECYQNQYFGSKQGVGVVMKLSGPAAGRLDVSLVSAPWNLDVYAADSPADSIEGWGKPVAQDASQRSTDATFTLKATGKYLLLMLREVARDKGCSGANPFRGGIAEITFASP